MPAGRSSRTDRAAVLHGGATLRPGVHTAAAGIRRVWLAKRGAFSVRGPLTWLLANRSMVCCSCWGLKLREVLAATNSICPRLGASLILFDTQKYN